MGDRDTRPLVEVPAERWPAGPRHVAKGAIATFLPADEQDAQQALHLARRARQ